MTVMADACARRHANEAPARLLSKNIHKLNLFQLFREQSFASMSTRVQYVSEYFASVANVCERHQY